MAESRRRPTGGFMASVALVAGVVVIRRTGHRRRAAADAVAGVALSDGRGIVIPAAADEGCRGVAIVTIQRGIDMRRHGVVLAGGTRGTVDVAIDAAGGNAGVVEGRRYEAVGVVANAAILVGLDVIGALVGREGPVVAENAIVDDTGMVEGRRQESRGLMALRAILIGRHVIGVFADRQVTIVAVGAIAVDTGVVVLGTSKGRGVVTQRTIVADLDRNMICR